MRRRERSGISFADWQDQFWPYLQAKAKRQNSPRDELLSRLSDGAKREIALSIFNYLRSGLWEKFRKERRRTSQQIQKKLRKTKRGLETVAKDYRALRELAPELGPGIVLGATALPGFVDSLEAEAKHLEEQKARARTAFNYKRQGNRTDLGNLFRLQCFLQEAQRRLSPLSGNRSKSGLTTDDLADLIEAGKAASGLPEDQTEVQTGPMERALQRFKSHPANAGIAARLQRDAIETCDRLGIRSASPTDPEPCDTK